jgi:hypothetical protein
MRTGLEQIAGRFATLCRNFAAAVNDRVLAVTTNYFN